MTDRFATCLAFVLAREGLFSNNPADPGGATMKGITQRTYDAYRLSKGLPKLYVSNISDAEVQDIYRSEYWTPVHCDQVPVGVDLCLFDFGVNAGQGTSVRILQQALGITPDGLNGPMTIAAAKGANPKMLANRMLDLRAAYYRDIVAKHPDQAIFKTGWLARVDALRALI